jgi:hypothetical protein
MDLQDVVVTVVAACALFVLVRPLLPAALSRRRPGAGPACPACAAGMAACGKERRVEARD